MQTAKSCLVILILTFTAACYNHHTAKDTRAIPTAVQAVLYDTLEFEELNRDHTLRDSILGLGSDWETLGGLQYFDTIGITVLEQLLIHKFIDPNGYWNEAPNTLELYLLMNLFPDIKAHGYAVSPDRNDYRVTLEGLYVAKDKVTPDMAKAFKELCQNADEYYDQDELYSWWD